MKRNRRYVLFFLSATVVLGSAFFAYEREIRDRFFASAPHGAVYNAATSKTMGGYRGSPAEVQLSGQLLHSILIGQSHGQRISLIARDGTTLWTRGFDRPVKGLELDGPQLFFATSRSIGSLDLANGETNWKIHLSHAVSGIGTNAGKLIVLPGFQLSRPYYVDFEASDAFTFTEVPMLGPYAHPRHIVRVEDTWVVADTFAHTVRVLDAQSGAQRAYRAAYFPNLIHASQDGSLVIAEEHGNRILRWWPTENKSEIVLACPNALFSNALASPEALQEGEGETWHVGRSVCDARTTPDAIYSPNGFHLVDGQHLYVADTDNHRVAFFDLSSGERIGTVTGLNSPNRVIALDQSSN
ncbi:MAG: hypothetical protein AAFY59_00635 [Pseudomonadota bacterium]